MTYRNMCSKDKEENKQNVLNEKSKIGSCLLFISGYPT